MIRIRGDRHDGHRIERDDGVTIGSIRNQAIRLTGFATDREALDVVAPLWAALDSMLATQYPGWPRYQPVGALRIAHDGAWEWATDGQRPLARLVRGGAKAGLGVEFVLPSYATDGALISAATALVHALDRHREAQPATLGAAYRGAVVAAASAL